MPRHETRSYAHDRAVVTGSRSGSDSHNASRASASDKRHDEKKLQQGKSIKAGTEQSGKLKKSQGGRKN